MIIPTAPSDPSSPAGLNGLRSHDLLRTSHNSPPSLLRSRSTRSHWQAAAQEPGEAPATLHCNDNISAVALHHSTRHRRLCSIETPAASMMLHRNSGGHRRSSIAALLALRRSYIEALDGLDGASSRPTGEAPLAATGAATQRTAKTAEAENLICSAGDHGGCCHAALAAMGAATQHDVHDGNSNKARATTAKAAMQRGILQCSTGGHGGCCDAMLPETCIATQCEMTAATMAKSCDAAVTTMAKSCDAAPDVRGAAPSATAGAVMQHRKRLVLRCKATADCGGNGDASSVERMRCER